jgi:thiosulfate reductase/polysulfide reductase chain A
MDERPLADCIQSRYIMLWGWNPTSAIKWVHLPRIITRSIERGARLVVIDPYLSDTAVKAHEWVSLRPATDGALALAMGHVIVRDELYDADFVNNWTAGFDEYKAYVADKTPEWAEEITTVPAATVERLAREVATTKPACIDVWSGPGQHSNGVQGGRAIALLGALVGGYDRPGGMMIPDRKGGKHFELEPDAVAEKSLEEPRYDELGKFPVGHSSGVYCQSFQHMADGTGAYEPKVVINVFQNPMMSVPGLQTVAKALTSVEMLVVIDTMLSETAQLADYVLPGTTYLERYDVNSHWVTWPVVGLRQPVVKPIFGQLAEYETVAALGRRLDLRDAEGDQVFLNGPLSGEPIEDLTAWYEDNLSNELSGGGPAMTLEEMKALPGATWVDEGGTKYEKYAAELAPEKLETAWFSDDPKADGSQIFDKPKEEGGKRIGTVIGGKPVRGFMTGSGKVEFVSSALKEKADANGDPIDPLPTYVPRDWVPDDDFPLYLINWKEASHTHTRTQNNPWLLAIKPDNPLIVHPDTAERFGIDDEDEVIVESPFGKTTAKVKTSRRIHPEVVGLQHGFGHTSLGQLAKGRGTSDTVLRPTKADPISGQALHKQTCVRLTKA